VLTQAQYTKGLKDLGFLGSAKTMIANFQRGYALGSALVVDGLYGSKTDAALQQSLARMRGGKPTAAPNFSFREFRCKCNGRYSTCPGVWVLRSHLLRLQAARAKVGAVSIVSGCRCPSYNRSVGGASNSQHLYGAACDVSFPNYRTVKSWRLFAGIGYKGSTSRTLHVDSRDLAGHNATRGTTLNPTTWVYA
jgi:zinc D-Ala-D-Ala carboxypeptidase